MSQIVRTGDIFTLYGRDGFGGFVCQGHVERLDIREDGVGILWFWSWVGTLVKTALLPTDNIVVWRKIVNGKRTVATAGREEISVQRWECEV